MLEHGARRSHGIAAAGTDGAEPVVRLDYVAISREQESGFRVRNDQQRFQMTQGAVFTPFLGQLDGGFLEIAGMFLELALETLEEGDGVSCRACEARNHFVIEKAASLARRVL